MAPRILLVEDEPDMVLGLTHNLKKEGYQVAVARDGEQGLHMALNGPWALIVLDLMLPARSGFALLEGLRKQDRETPVLILSARSSELDKVRGLDLGADDYLTKPFSLGELLARVRARLRRKGAVDEEPRPVRLGPVTVHLARSTVERDGRETHLTPFEKGILAHLLEHPGRIVSRTELLDQVWGYDRHPSTRTVDNHIARLRKKIEVDPADPGVLMTVHGQGYLLELPG